jgi:hypothetical protein
MVKIGDPHPQGALAIAQSLAELGLQVLPARFKDKSPIVKWTEYQDRRTTSNLPMWFGGGVKRNYWVMTGRISGHVVVDADSAEGDKWWRERLGDAIFDATAQVKTAKGTHYWFAIPADWPEDRHIQSWATHPNDDPKHGPDPDHTSFDFRADVTGVIVPPSIHESGHVYTWTVPLEEAVLAPPEMLDGTLRAQAPARAGEAPGGTARDSGGHTRSMLAHLLEAPPSGDGSGRNDWLARVAGHYAKSYHNQRDLYDLHCKQAYDMIPDKKGFDAKEYEKTVESVWRGEHERNPHRALDETCGWLQSGGTRIVTQVVKKDPNADTRTYELEEYADFDLQAKGVMLDEEQGRTYWVQIVRKRRGVGDTETIDAVLPAHVTGDDKALRKWLAKFACTVIPPENMWPRTGSVGVRLQRYLESQHPPAVKVTATLGWDSEIINGDGGFVTHDGVITADEVFECEAVGVRPNPALLVGGMAPHRYGFGADQSEARRVLEEVLTFHDDTTTSVFGAWWAACLIKPQLEERSSLFPFMAIEAPSESGKTNGFFDLMTQLNGNTRGEVAPTKAALRDMAAAHRNGIVWVDDLDDPAYLMELLRAATSGGSLTKMGEDRESVKNTQIVSPIVISGEALGLGSQKALLDRAIILKVGSPTGRVSRHNPRRPQWDDVLALRGQYAQGLSVLAGHLVQAALDVVPFALVALADGRKGSGRAADKAAILRAGARLLDCLVATDDDGRAEAWQGTGQHAVVTEAWLESQETESAKFAENALTFEILPWAMRHFNYAVEPRAGIRPEDMDTPVFVRGIDENGQFSTDGDSGLEIWFNAVMLAEAWERFKNGRVERRTQTATALKDQADALHAPAKRFKVISGGGRKYYYRKIDGGLASIILERSRGK